MSSLLTIVSLVIALASSLRVVECAPDLQVSPSDSGHSLVTKDAEKANITARCHVACFNFLFEVTDNGTNGTNGTNGASEMGSADMLQEGVFQLNCNQFKQYLDCRNGCISAQSESQDSCPVTCKGRCQGLCKSTLGCFGLSVDNNDCGVKCNREHCTEGCQRFTEGTTLTSPLSAPELVPLGSRHMYGVVIPEELELFKSEHPSLVFRIEDQSQPGEYVYQWMVDVIFELPNVTMVEYMLDLSSYIGQTVNVSYAFATNMSFSEYSESVEIRVGVTGLVSPSDSGHLLVTESEEEAVKTAYCHVTCINYIFEKEDCNINCTGNQTETSPGDHMATNLTPGMEGVISLDCGQFKKYLDCRSGCIAQSEDLDNCADTCKGRCQGLCGSTLGCFGMSVDDNDCGVQCNRDDCSEGCQQYTELETTHMPSPMNAPELKKVTIRLYDVILPDELDMYMDEYPSLLFRLEDQSKPGEYVYQWMLDVTFALPNVIMMEYMLDLSSYSGLSLNIAYAFVTNTSVSNFSDTAEVHIPERCLVKELKESDLDISLALDERVGSFPNYVLNVSWPPTNCVDEVSEYIVTRTSADGNCGDRVSETVGANSSSVLLLSEKHELPCTVKVEVQTILIDETTLKASKNRRLSSDLDGFVPKLKNVGCPVTYDHKDEKYKVKFQWRAPFPPSVLSHIDFFLIRVHEYLREDTILATHGNPPKVYLKTFNNSLFNFTTRLNPFEDINRYYRMGVEVFWKEGGGPSRSGHCDTADAPAPPPLPIEMININESDTTMVIPNGLTREVRVFVSFEWEKPELQYTDDILDYQVHLALEPLEPTATPDQIGSHGTQLSGSINKAFTGIDSSKTNLTAFLQIRSRQFENIPSNWSEPKEINFTVLEKPDKSFLFPVTLEEVNVEYDGNKTFVVITGTVEWESLNIDHPVKLEKYEIHIGDRIVKSSEPTTEFTKDRFLLHGDSLNINIKVVSVVSLYGKEEKSDESNVREIHIKSIPSPKILSFSGINPRLREIKSSNMLNFSMELSVSWDHPQFDEEINSYEIYFGVGEIFRVYDHLREEIGRNVPTNTTEFSYNFNEEVDPKSTELFVQMRSLIPDVSLLPQWSGPEPLKFSHLPVPDISSSEVSIDVTSAMNTDDLYVTTEVALAWEEPLDLENLTSYDVWIGSRALRRFEEPEESDMTGKIFSIPVTTESVKLTETLTASFTSPSGEDVTINVQMRSVGPLGVPVWGEAVQHDFIESPPPQITKIKQEHELDLENKEVEVVVMLEWELQEPTEAPPTDAPVQPKPSSMVPTVTLSIPLPTPSSSPVDLGTRQRRQLPGEENGFESGSGLRELTLTGIFIYMGTTPLEPFEPRLAKNVQEVQVGKLNEEVKMTYDIDVDNLKNLDLFIQMQIEAEEGFPRWSDPMNITVDILSSTMPPTTMPPTTEAVSSKDETDNTLLIILLVVIPIIILLIIAILFVAGGIYRNRMKYKIITGDDELDLYSRPGGLTGIYSGKGPVLDEWEISPDDVIVDQLLGEGAFGEVYKGVIRGPLANPKVSAVLRQAIGVPVAIKLLKSSSAGKEKSDFLAEIDMMKKIAEGYNNHIVNMVGCVTLQEPLCLITEFVPFGDLLSYLKYQRKKRSEIRRREKQLQQENATENGDIQPAPYLEPGNAYSHLEPKEELEVEDDGDYKELGDIETDDLIRFAYQIASGMEYLASLKIVHRDLACRNVLIAKDKLLKITDFGLSREVQEVYVKKTRGRLPLKWMAIESITAREFTSASDVWAFGVTLYEIGTIGGFPYPSINNEDLLRMLSQGYRLEKPDNCSAEVYDLMLQCWQEEPGDRPSFAQLRSKFSAMLQAGSTAEYIDLQINEEAPYYQIRDDERERSASVSSSSSEGSVSSIDKEKAKGKKKLKRKKTNPYVPSPEQAGNSDGAYLDMAGQERPQQLGIQLSQLMPSSQAPEHQPTPVEESVPQDHAPLERRTTNPYVSEPSESIVPVPASVPVGNGLESLRESSVETNGLTESTHL